MNSCIKQFQNLQLRTSGIQQYMHGPYEAYQEHVKLLELKLKKNKLPLQQQKQETCFKEYNKKNFKGRKV